jgi:hypothetical protein
MLCSPLSIRIKFYLKVGLSIASLTKTFAQSHRLNQPDNALHIHFRRCHFGTWVRTMYSSLIHLITENSINAAALAPEAKTFKFMIEDSKKGKFYLASASGAGTQDPSKAMDCSLSGDVLKCGGKGFTSFGFGDMVKLSTTGSSKGWSIDSSNTIHWNARPSMRFSVRYQNEMWAEVCPDLHGHFYGQHGDAKAEFI